MLLVEGEVEVVVLLLTTRPRIMHRAHDLETPAGLTLLSFGLSQPKAYLEQSTVYFLKSGFFGIFHRGGWECVSTTISISILFHIAQKHCL